MENAEQLRDAALKAVPGARIEVTGATSAEPGLIVDREHIYAVAKFFKEDERYRMDFCSCVTGVDYLPKKKLHQPVPTATKSTDAEVTEEVPGYIEVVYHLYSVAKRHGPITLRVRVPREVEKCRSPSLTPLWRSCEFQEREVFDLFGVVFEGHPDLRRILMWDGFKDFPMRKDYEPSSAQESELALGGYFSQQNKAVEKSIPESGK